MFKCIVSLTVLLILQPGLMMQAQSSQQGAKRNAAAYDKAGPYTLDNELPPEENARKSGEIRRFLWEHWKERRLGLIKATFYTIEGDPTVSTFFVEPDAKGIWHIRIDSKSTISALLPKGIRPRNVVTHEDYDEVDRVKTTGTTPPTLEPMAESEICQPLSYELRLRNSVTNLVRSF